MPVVVPLVTGSYTTVASHGFHCGPLCLASSHWSAGLKQGGSVVHRPCPDHKSGGTGVKKPQTLARTWKETMPAKQLVGKARCDIWYPQFRTSWSSTQKFMNWSQDIAAGIRSLKSCHFLAQLGIQANKGLSSWDISNSNGHSDVRIRPKQGDDFFRVRFVWVEKIVEKVIRKAPLW